MILRQPSQILRTNSSCCFRTLPSTVTNAHISRSIHRTAWLNYPSKDSQDKDSLNPRSTEYSKSQSDDNSARIEKTAFDPNETSPEGQMAMANKESGQVSFFLFALFFRCHVGVMKGLCHLILEIDGFHVVVLCIFRI